MTADTKLPDFPAAPIDPYRNEHVVLLCYERARAEAAMARLRVAVEALHKVRYKPFVLRPDAADSYNATSEYATEALAAIGPLPPLPELPTLPGEM